MLVTLRRVQVSFFEGCELLGFLEVEQDDGQSKLYSFRLPTPETPRPPGWGWIEKLSGVTAADVIAAWDELRTANTVAQQAALDISTRYSGERFVASVVPRPDATPTIELVPLDREIAAPKKLHQETNVTPELPPRYTTCFHISVDTPALGGPSFLVLHITEVPEDKWPRFKVPDKNDRTPNDWWFVETFTGIAHERVAQGWAPDKPTNAILDDAIRLLGGVIEQYNRVPLKSDGTVDIARWRKELVRFRLSLSPKELPFVFLGRHDHTIEHTKAILYDALGDFIFRANVDAGKSLGCPAMILDSDGKAALKHLDDPDLLRGIIVRNIRHARTGRPPKPVLPSKELLADIITLPPREWPVIQGIVRIPTVREDGTIINKAGYDKAAQLWYAPEFELEPIPEHPTGDDVQRARALLLTPVADFPFIDEGARTGALCSLFEQVVRPMIKGPRPLYIFDAPEQGQGTGKTLLAKVFQAIITGAEPSISALGKREEEVEKRITSLLRQGDPFIILDNLTREVTSEALQQLATSERWQARLLNTNDAPIYPQNATWILTLNGAKMNRDIARRTVLCRLDAKTPNAYERTGFKIEDVIAWARDRRAALIRAVLVLVRSWVVAGRPVDKEVVRGSFEAWCRVIGGIMKHAGFNGLPHALRASQDRDVNNEDHRLLFQLWLAEIPPGQPVPASVIGALAQRNGLYPEHLPKGRDVAPMGLGKAMAPILKGSLVGQNIDGYTVQVHPTRQNGFRCYVLMPASAPPLAPPPPPQLRLVPNEAN